MEKSVNGDQKLGSHFKRRNQKLCRRRQRYSALRRVRGDGNCFYRSFLFGYLERLLQGIKSPGDANTKAMLELSRLRQVVHERFVVFVLCVRVAWCWYVSLSVGRRGAVVVVIVVHGDGGAAVTRCCCVWSPVPPSVRDPALVYKASQSVCRVAACIYTYAGCVCFPLLSLHAIFAASFKNFALVLPVKHSREAV